MAIASFPYRKLAFLWQKRAAVRVVKNMLHVVVYVKSRNLLQFNFKPVFCKD